LRGAERGSKLKDKDKITSPSARNDTQDRMRVLKREFKSGEAPLNKILNTKP